MQNTFILSILECMTKKEEKKLKKAETNQAPLPTQTAWEAKLAQQEEITKKAQLDYINLKADFDFLTRQIKLKEQTMEQETLLKVIKKLLPFVEDLRKSLLHLTEVQKTEGLGKGVQIVYDKFLATLAELEIFPIDEIAVPVDPELHEPISVVPAQDEAHKGTIVQIFDQGFVLRKEGQQKVILPSKVVVAQ